MDTNSVVDEMVGILNSKNTKMHKEIVTGFFQRFTCGKEYKLPTMVEFFLTLSAINMASSTNVIQALTDIEDTMGGFSERLTALEAQQSLK